MNIEQVREKFKGAYVAKYEKAVQNSCGLYLSDRHDENIPLVCQELNVLTVEDYDKWYGLYYLMEDPDTKEIMLVKLCHGDILEGIDHEYYPDAVIRFCLENNLMIDTISFLCINKSLLLYNEDKLENHLASLYDTSKGVIKIVRESKSNTFYLYGKYDSYSGYSIEGSLVYKV